jgi:hypothetical protein
VPHRGLVTALRRGRGRAPHQTVTCPDPAAARAITAAHLAVNEQALASGWTTWRQGPRADDLLWQAIASTAPAHYDVLRWQSGNREAELHQVQVTRAGDQASPGQV